MSHIFRTGVRWIGNHGSGTSDYQAYSRDHVISIKGHPDIPGSSAPQFRGDPSRYNPEDLLVASLSACHMLWYLHLCSVNKIVVTDYTDQAEGIMKLEADGSGQFTSVTLHPRVTITADSDEPRAMELHREAHRLCFIANSVNFSVTHEPEITKS